MATKEVLQDKLAAIERRKAVELARIAVQRQRVQAALAKLDRPSKSARRLDARRKILVGSFLLDRLSAAGIEPADLEHSGVRFRDWLSRDGDRAVFDLPPKG